MKRCLFEYYSTNKCAIKADDGKRFIKEIFVAVEIEGEIEKLISKANCSTNKSLYSTQLISAISRMYEVFYFNLIFQEGKYINEYDKTKPNLSSIKELKSYVNASILENGGNFSGIPDIDDK